MVKAVIDWSGKTWNTSGPGGTIKFLKKSDARFIGAQNPNANITGPRFDLQEGEWLVINVNSLDPYAAVVSEQEGALNFLACSIPYRLLPVLYFSKQSISGLDESGTEIHLASDEYLVWNGDPADAKIVKESELRQK